MKKTLKDYLIIILLIASTVGLFTIIFGFTNKAYSNIESYHRYNYIYKK